MKDTEKDIEKNIAAQLSSEDEVAFKVSDDELVKRATVSANNQQGTKDLVALGMASIWVVFISIFMNILKPVFKQMEVNKKMSTHSKNNVAEKITITEVNQSTNGNK